MKKKTFLFGILILILVLSGTILVLAANQSDTLNPTVETGSADGVVYFHTGSPLALSNGEIKMLDPANPDLGATVIQSRTVLPLRAVSEHFGAEVDYDQTKKAAIVKYGGKQYTFAIGSRSYIVESGQQTSEYPMDTESVILDGRTMVPLRVICESVLGKKVSYYDRVIAVADHEINLKADDKLVSDVKSKIGEAVKAGSLNELKKILADEGNRISYGVDAVDGFGEVMDEATPAMESEASNGQAKSQSGSDSGSYSTTNTQVEGIDEADIVKTDGKYIYIGGNNVVRIVGAIDGKLSDDTAIRLSTDKNVREIYVDENRLVILGTRYQNDSILKEQDEPVMDMPADSVSVEKSIGIMPPYYPSKSFSFADVYDISNPLKPILLKGHEMEGDYHSSRKNGEIVYMVTNSHPYKDNPLPLMRDTVVSDQEFTMRLDDIMIMPKHPCSGYLVISAVNVNHDEKTEVEAITAYGATMYMNDSSMYLAFNNYESSTSIIRFDLEGMKMGYAGSGIIPGYLLNQFSMDEYQDHLRVATTEWDKQSNSLFILNQSLNVVGSVEDLAKGESIYSVRFLGDKGYVVTFRTIDPLFVFDLSDPKKPVLTGELKVPGFSSYLHPIGDDLLLGIGADVYDIYRRDGSGKEVVVGSRQGGIKFSLFDISDMGKPKEISNCIVGDAGSWSEALNNHKAIMIDQFNENVAFDASLNYENQENGYQQGAIVMSYREETLKLKGILLSQPSGVYGNYIPYARRVLYIGDELYYIQDGRITSYSYENLKQIDTLILQ